MNLAEDFRDWAVDRTRTNEELFLAELLLEAGHTQWRRIKNCRYEATDYDADCAMRKRRKLNPAYRACLDPEQLAQTVEAWAEVKTVQCSVFDDRPVRDLAALRFFPHLETLDLRSELSDLAPLAALPRLKDLRLSDDYLGDLAGLAALPMLEKLNLRLGWPWPSSIRCLAQLPRLRQFDFHSNLLALTEIPELPAVDQAHLSGGGFGTPLQDLFQLPAMPCLRKLTVESTASLRGLERYPRLEELSVKGLFSDLTPLAGLTQLRELNLQGERFLDLGPVAQLPRLRTLELGRERGLDLTPLSDAPRLREVKAPHCTVLATELATLNAALGWVDVSDFLAPEPRPLGKLRFISWRANAPDFEVVKHVVSRSSERAAAFGDDPVMEPAEERWFTALVEEKLKPFIAPGWGKVDCSLPASAWVKIYRLREARQLRSMIEALRPLLASARFFWEIIFEVRVNCGPDDDDAFEIPDRTIYNAEAEREDWEEAQRYLRERKEFLENEHRLRLQQQQGIWINPENFSPQLAVPAADAVSKPEEEAKATEVPVGEDDEKVDFMVFLRGNFLWAHFCDSEEAAKFVGEYPEDWHQLPEPPEQRPYPHCW